ncbi:DUF3667 domain-containing protein [Winogradskyella eckloniae]|uniref:DUF3667 domain-containing protein n=1 Tax=Winogradskyella eckloniae TaxID=1089306 RepID=UPI001563BEEA|nr:DUF3667 domain-containing protein [Winogradskyella eckloniae]NRD19532.1 DUF3667 domain-containing protein [Winogradskyella eckloniae]
MHCKNCNNTLRESQKFCDECGAKIIYNRLKPKVLVTQVNEQFLCVDNKFLRTFIHLFTQPEKVIVSYIDGTRKKYIDVLQYFAIALTLAGIQLFIMSTFFKESFDFQSGFVEGFNASSKSQEDNPFKDLKVDTLNKYQSLIYIATVPFYAFGTWLTYYVLGQRKYNFTEHIVINLYYYGQVIILTAIIAIVLSIFGIDYMLIASILLLPTIAYLFFILKRIFKDKFWATLLRFIIVGFIAISLFFIAGILIAILFIILSKV